MGGPYWGKGVSFLAMGTTAICVGEYAQKKRRSDWAKRLKPGLNSGNQFREEKTEHAIVSFATRIGVAWNSFWGGSSLQKGGRTIKHRALASDLGALPGSSRHVEKRREDI